MTTCFMCCNMATMGQHEHVTLKVWKETRHLLRLLSALLGKPMVEVLHWLVSREYDKHKDKL